MAKVVIFGNGFVGSRLLRELTLHGFPAKVFDREPDRSDFSSRGDATSWGDIWIICLPTGLDAEGNPDTKLVGEYVRQLSHEARPDKPLLTVLESTVPPGFCLANWQAPEPFAYCPERLWAGGEPKWGMQNIPRVVAGNSSLALERAIGLYSILAPSILPVSLEVAELCKLYENGQRAVNILLAHELKRICEERNLDVLQVLKACETKPFGYATYFPGKIEGECIPMAISFLLTGAKKHMSATILRVAETEMWRMKHEDNA